jgi:glycosyltransferase involved in cell wall biosynthesis
MSTARLRIAIVGPPWVPVPPPAYGGTETVLAGLLRGLARAGHDVAYAGHPRSTVDVEPLGGIEATSLGPIGHTLSELVHVLQATEAAEAWGADVVHFHTTIVPGRHEMRAPMVITHHGPFDALATPYFERLGTRCAVVAISKAQAAGAPTVPLAAVSTTASTWTSGRSTRPAADTCSSSAGCTLTRGPIGPSRSRGERASH